MSEPTQPTTPGDELRQLEHRVDEVLAGLDRHIEQEAANHGLLYATVGHLFDARDAIREERDPDQALDALRLAAGDLLQVIGTFNPQYVDVVRHDEYILDTPLDEQLRNVRGEP